ncbi:MAG: STAS domain-containing protein [Gammaproteobacteria bacterium]
MSCTVAATEGGVFRISGELCVFHAADLKAQLLDILHASNECVIDLREVSEVDTAGLQLLLMAKREAAGIGCPLSFVNHSEPVLDAINLTNLAWDLGDPMVIPASQSKGGTHRGPE